jgi:hypothetical protein
MNRRIVQNQNVTISKKPNGNSALNLSREVFCIVPTVLDSEKSGSVSTSTPQNAVTT